MNRNFDILLIGGASGVGKSRISDQLSKTLDLNVVLVDDFQCIVEHFTREEDYPMFHFWSKHYEEVVKLPMEGKLQIMIDYANQFSKALELVIDNHLEENRPMILEGDFISPDLCKTLLSNPEKRKRIKCLFITEDDVTQIQQNYFERENRIQVDRSLLSWHYNNWLVEQSENTDIAIMSSRPWETLEERVLEYLIKKI